ncbi:hypothetical protein [Bradyrhizobium erythrophlei]|uniref:Uncharacterized protein n=1 Tax=Bradyrhizobium erythrophlei TaxID=1437360 RepID=A0A1M5NJE7_9BRAD|nr:hypothetical protein [Bradyrhizobium erythrophlei]SHG89714.1 hypothetical protein SAMN05443248_3021 [Bradyrhizobium erythrophlei]
MTSKTPVGDQPFSFTVDPQPVDYGTIGNIRFSPSHVGAAFEVPHVAIAERLHAAGIIPPTTDEIVAAAVADNARRDKQPASDEALRDHFAGQALPTTLGWAIKMGGHTPAVAADLAYDVADAMMAERARRSAR